MKQLVYIDDEEMLCRVVSRILVRVEVETLTFLDPREALAHINAHPPALVICDYRMPQMTGLELFEQLEVQVPFALISGDLRVADGQAPGVLDVLPKPIRSEDLIAFVERMIA